MTSLNVAFFYESMGEFLPKDYTKNKLTQIIPYFVISDTRDVYAMLTVNKSQCVGDFGTDWRKNKTLQTYVVDSIVKSSLGCIQVDEDYVLANSFVGYATADNVIEGKRDLAENEIPTVFVKFVVDNIDSLNDILIKFKDNYSKSVKRVIGGSSNISNLVYMPVEDLYYVSRFTTYRINTSDGNIVIDMEEDGFPALPVITDIYSPIPEFGDIPCGDRYNELGNCCPPVTFYSSRSVLLRIALLPLFDGDFPILDASA